MSYLPVIAVVDDEIVRATHGLTDLVSRPTIEVKACYGVPKTSHGVNAGGDVTINGTPQLNRADVLVGEALDKALAEDPDAVEVRWPFAPEDKIDWEGREIVLLQMYAMLNIKPSNNTHPLLLVPPASSPTLPLPEQELYTQMVFENLNAPQLALFPNSIISLLGLNATTGIVLHIGRSTSTVAVVFDSIVRWECATSVDIGELDCEAHLEGLLLADERLDKELKNAAGVESFAPRQKEKYVREIREFIFAECTGDDIEVPLPKGARQKTVEMAGKADKEEEGFDIAKKLTADVAPPPQIANSHKSKKQQAQMLAAAQSKAQAAADAAIAADIITVTIPSLPEKEIVVGQVRHRLAEPLLQGKARGGDTVWEAIGRAVENSALNGYERVAVWEGLAIVGDMARFKSLPIAIATYVSPYLLSSSDLPSDSQPGRVKLLSIPEYFANYKGAAVDLAPFIGASMVAKLAFNESQGKHYVSKLDYNSHGPSCIHGVWPEAQ
ncbi:hypothetical protein CspeluHIS016_0202740 [Cutaneotrichosporon spelunceum]|uniref:RNA polymerase II transcription factor n=1 Tax=Cutaneotrichosporon spelunceum TaxID=1672016 RepID=A0AAD3TR64_9TREE|nr:hypothetical protein CspeluHIS016_0202740 [Cutaneotrichosporon spelunceum]